MIGKIIAFVALVAVVVSAEPCGVCGGLLSNGISGFGGVYGSRVLNAGCSVPVVSSVPACSPVAVPSEVIEPIATPIVASSAVAPVVNTGVVSSRLCGSGVYGSRIYGGYGYGSTLGGYESTSGGFGYGSILGGCNANVLATVF